MSARVAFLLVCAVALCALFTGGVRADTELEGHWRGTVVRLNATQSIEIDLRHIDGTLTGTYAIPDLFLYDEPLREVAYDDSTVTLRILYGPFTLRRQRAHNEMTGGNERWNPPLAMHLKRGVFEPVPWYASEDVTIPVGVDTLAATVFKPLGDGPFPAVAVVPGSGDQSRADWHLRAHAFALVKAGVACMIYDKRGVGGSTGSYDDKTFHQLARDASAAIGALRERNDIHGSNVGLMGISQGGWISTIAAHRDPAPDFVIFMEGPARSLYDQNLDRVRYQMMSNEFASESVDSAVAHTQLYFDAMSDEGKWPDLERSTAGARASAWSDYVSLPDTYNDADMRWWRNAVYDPADDLRTLPVRALAILGQHDPVVSVQENRHLFERYLAEAGVDHRVEVIPGLYHAAATYHSLEGGSWDWPQAYWVWSKRPPALDTVLGPWITDTDLDR